MKLGWNTFDWKHNCAMVVLNALGESEFRNAKTPNLENFADKDLGEAYTAGTFTPATFAAFFRGYLPWKGTKTQVFGRPIHLPQEFKDKGYETFAWISAPYLFTGSGFDIGFDFYKDMEKPDMGEEIVKDALKKLNEPYFAIFDFFETHRPFFFRNKTDWHTRELEKYNYENGEIDENYLAYLRDCQIRAAEHLDHILKPLLNKFRRDNAFVIITSDHGTCFGEGHVCGHGIGDSAAIEKQTKVFLLFHFPRNLQPKTI